MHKMVKQLAHLRRFLQLCYGRDARLHNKVIQLGADHVRPRVMDQYRQEDKQQPLVPTHVAVGTGSNLMTPKRVSMGIADIKMG